MPWQLGHFHSLVTKNEHIKKSSLTDHQSISAAVCRFSSTWVGMLCGRVLFFTRCWRMGPFLISSISPVETLPESGCWKQEHCGIFCDQKQCTNDWPKSWPEAVTRNQLNLFSLSSAQLIIPCREGDICLGLHETA